MLVRIAGHEIRIELERNPSVDALRALLQKAPLYIRMKDFAQMEKFGDLGVKLPAEDETITTGPGDVILSEGRLFVIYYASNTWRFTRLGKVVGMDAEGLKQALGNVSADAELLLLE